VLHFYYTLPFPAIFSLNGEEKTPDFTLLVSIPSAIRIETRKPPLLLSVTILYTHTTKKQQEKQFLKIRIYTIFSKNKEFPKGSAFFLRQVPEKLFPPHNKRWDLFTFTRCPPCLITLVL